MQGKLRLILLTGAFALAAPLAAPKPAAAHGDSEAQVVALDECDPTTFNANPAIGANFCLNVALGAHVTLTDLLTGAQAGTPNPGWDFEPDTLTVPKGTTLSVVNQGGEPHTFTEVQQFGDGFLPPLNPNMADDPVPECAGGFANVKVAATRILQGSHREITGLSEGTHLFECCIHPWMRFQVDVVDDESSGGDENQGQRRHRGHRRHR